MLFTILDMARMKFFFLKTLLLCGFSLVFAVSANGQTGKIQEMEAALRDLSGPARVQLQLKLSDACRDAGDARKAESYAEDAADFARRIREPELRAIALNRQGKIMLETGKKRGAGKLEQSLEILRQLKSNNKPLALDNLMALRNEAAKAGASKDMDNLDAQITLLKNGGPILSDPADAKAALQQALRNTQQKLAANQSEYKESELKMLRESQDLQNQLADREAEISRMSEEQMKTAMLVMQQRVLIDSVLFHKSMDSLTVSNANLALREAESNRKFNYAIMLALLLLAGGSTLSFIRARQNARVLAEKNKTIREEQSRSENLLLNILPALVADELKQKGRTDARYFDDVSVLFADFIGFSKIAERLSPQQLVSELDTCFQQFDDIIARHGLEKIKTIGDAYMCAGGLPDGGGSRMKSMVLAAFDMQNWLMDWNMERSKSGQPRFDARIGIHRGPVVAGVVGSIKFAFDIWGDTVNVAARIEQAGEAGKINISGDAYTLVKQDFSCHYRGKIPAKNKGEIDMYFVEN